MPRKYRPVDNAFGEGSPSPNLNFPHGKLTAAEIIAYLPHWIKSIDVINRFISNGARAQTIASMVDSFRHMPGGVTYPSNSVCITMQNAMRKADYADWTISQHATVQWPPTNTTDRTGLDVTGFRTPCITHPKKSKNKKKNKKQLPEPPIEFRELALHVKQHPTGDDALDLTRCIRYALDYPDESWLFPNDFEALVQHIGGPQDVNTNHEDAQCFARRSRTANSKRAAPSTSSAQSILHPVSEPALQSAPQPNSLSAPQPVLHSSWAPSADGDSLPSLPQPSVPKHEQPDRNANGLGGLAVLGKRRRETPTNTRTDSTFNGRTYDSGGGILPGGGHALPRPSKRRRAVPLSNKPGREFDCVYATTLHTWYGGPVDFGGRAMAFAQDLSVRPGYIEGTPVDPILSSPTANPQPLNLPQTHVDDFPAQGDFQAQEVSQAFLDSLPSHTANFRPIPYDVAKAYLESMRTHVDTVPMNSDDFAATQIYTPGPTCHELHRLNVDPLEGSDWAEAVRWAKRQHELFRSTWTDEEESLNMIKASRLRTGWISTELQALFVTEPVDSGQ